ncbi:MAG: DUF1799 domain-containing protein [Candidatus Limnocylindrus sp.]
MDHLFRSKGDTAQLQRDAEVYGVILQSHHLQPEHFCLWADLWPVVNLFMKCLTQWRSGPSGVLGLDYGAVFLMAPLLGTSLDAAMMDDMQTMEIHARDLLNRQLRRG